MHLHTPASLALIDLLAIRVAADPRAAIEWACGMGYRMLQFDATAVGLRPRELGASARRDFSGLLARRGIRLSGIDVFVPPPHFLQAERVDRAVSAVRDAVDLSASWGALPVSIALTSDVPHDVVDSIASAAERSGVTIVNCGWPPLTDNAVAHRIRPGIDPTTLGAAGINVLAAVAQSAGQISAARLPGALMERQGSGGSFELDAYRVGLSVAGYAGPLVCDLRGVSDQVAGAARLLRAVEGVAS